MSGNDQDTVETSMVADDRLFDPKGRLLIPVVEAGKMLGYGRNGSYQAANKGEILTVKIGNKKRVPWSWLVRKATAWMA